MTAQPSSPVPPDQPAVSRRRILGRLSLAAVGGSAMAATGIVGGGRAAAANGDEFLMGQTNIATSLSTLLSYADGLEVLLGNNDRIAIMADGGAISVWGRSLQGGTGVKAGVYGNVYFQNKPGSGVVGQGPSNHAAGIGVEGLGYQGTGVLGETTVGIGVKGVASSSAGTGVGGTGVSGGTGVRGTVPNAGHGVLGRAGIGFGVKGEATNISGVGVGGVGANGGVAVRGTVPNQGYGVRGQAGSGFGVLGEVTTGVAVSGESTNNGWGVRGNAVNGGWGVQGISDTSFGVRGDSTGGTGVRGESQTSTGVYGRSINHTGVTGYGAIFGVEGQCDAGGTAVVGTSSSGGNGVRGEAITGVGVSGSADQGIAISGKGRVGGQFQGTRAAVRLVPTSVVGAPTTGAHLRGELVCDKNGQLWFCSADGTPGTWARIV